MLSLSSAGRRKRSKPPSQPNGLGFAPAKVHDDQGQTDGRCLKENQMAKGMSKPGKNVKKPKKDKAKPAVATPSTKNSVVINTNGPKD